MKKLLLLSLLFYGCDATIGKLKSLGMSANITCYSGGKLIYEGRSSGKVLSEKDSDGYYFKDKKTGNMLEVSGDCKIEYIKE